MTEERPIYHERIISDPAILVGKPTIKGTRISVELILEHLATNPDLAALFVDYPQLTIDDVRAALAYARDVVADTNPRAAAREQRFRRMLAVATHEDIDGDALLEELEREDATRRTGTRA